jgi:hypothetical protein
MNRSHFLIASFFLSCFLFLSACGFYRTTNQVDERALLQVTGNVEGLFLQMDDQPPIALESLKSFDLYGKKAIQIQVTPGAHTYKLIRKNETLSHRKFFVSAHETFEVSAP